MERMEMDWKWPDIYFNLVTLVLSSVINLREPRPHQVGFASSLTGASLIPLRVSEHSAIM